MNALCPSNTYKYDSGEIDSPKDFCHISNYSLAVIPLETQNFKKLENRQINYSRGKLKADHQTLDEHAKGYTNLGSKYLSIRCARAA